MKNNEYKKLLQELFIKNKSRGDKKEILGLCFKEMVTLFHSRNKRYPTATEFTHENLLPTARTIQRNYGGIPQFRKDMGLDITDYTKGEVRSKRAKKINNQAAVYENELFNRLYKKYHRPTEGVSVVREPIISTYDPDNGIYGYRRADVAINTFKESNCATFYVDFFFASDPYSLYGCVNIKKKKIQKILKNEDIIFVSVNPKMSTKDILKIKLPQNCPRVLSLQVFEQEFLQ